MNKTMRRLAIIFATVCVLMIMAVPSFAVTGAAGYEVGSPTTYSNPINVKIVIQSRQNTSSSSYIGVMDDVQLGQQNVSGQTFTVADVLVKYNQQQDEIEAQTSSGEEITSTQSVLYNFTKNNSDGTSITYAPLLYGKHGYTNRIKLDGWRFKVNGRFPLTSWTGDHNLYPEGADTSHTYIEDGDVVYFYTDHPWYESGVLKSALFMSADAHYTAPTGNQTTGSLAIQLYSNQDYYSNWSNNTFPWNVGTYTSYAPGVQYTAYVKKADGTSVGSTTLNTSGSGTLSCNLSSSEKYYVYVALRDWHNVSGYSGPTGSSTITVKHLARTIAYDRVQF